MADREQLAAAAAAEQRADWRTVVEAARERPGQPVTVYTDEDRQALRREADRLRAQADRLERGA